MRKINRGLYTVASSFRLYWLVEVHFKAVSLGSFLQVVLQCPETSVRLYLNSQDIHWETFLDLPRATRMFCRLSCLYRKAKTVENCYITFQPLLMYHSQSFSRRHFVLLFRSNMKSAGIGQIDVHIENHCEQYRVVTGNMGALSCYNSLYLFFKSNGLRFIFVFRLCHEDGSFQRLFFKVRIRR